MVNAAVAYLQSDRVRLTSTLSPEAKTPTVDFQLLIFIVDNE